MALIKCPECGNMISDRAEKCPHCGLPSAYFFALPEKKKAAGLEEIDYGNLHNVLLSFDRDYVELLSPAHYVSGKDRELHMRSIMRHWEMNSFSDMFPTMPRSSGSTLRS